MFSKNLLENVEAKANQVVYKAYQVKLDLRQRMMEYPSQATKVEWRRNKAIARAIATENARSTVIAEKAKVVQTLEYVEQDLHQNLDDAQQAIATLQHEMRALHITTLFLGPKVGMVNFDEPEDEGLEEFKAEDQEEIELRDDDQPMTSEDED